MLELAPESWHAPVKTKTRKDLEKLAKKLLSMPHKPREESKVGTRKDPALVLVGSVRIGFSRFKVLPSEPIINFFAHVVRSETVARMKGLLEALSPSSDSF